MNSSYCLNVLAFSDLLLGAGPFQETKIIYMVNVNFVFPISTN